MWRDNLRCIYYIALKDMRTYYLKPPSVSWGIVFPVAWILAFYLRNPRSFEELVPGLIAMTILFSTTAAEAVVINFELRLGSLERLLLAPVSLPAVLLGKVLGGAIFGLMMTTVMTIGSVLIIGLHLNLLYLVLIIIPSLLVFSSLLCPFMCFGKRGVRSSNPAQFTAILNDIPEWRRLSCLSYACGITISRLCIATHLHC